MNAADIQHALLVLPSSPVPPAHLARLRRGLTYRFPNLTRYTLTAPDACAPSHAQQLDTPVESFSQTRFWEFSVALILLGENQERQGTHLIDYNRCRVYEADAHGMIRYTRQALDPIEYPHLHTHPFTQIAGGMGNEHLAYFPYGYSTQYVGLGPLDPFGHRLAQPVSSYRERDPAHKLLAIFGGSAAWSIHCYHHETFAQKLEQQLNQYATTHGSPCTFTVLNMAQPSAVTLNNIQDYLLHFHKTRPDLVILHAGSNDLAFGQTSNLYLMAEHQIAYQFQLERWAEILHNGSDRRTPDADWTKLPIQTYPRVILDALLSRVAQFERLVHADRADFLFALQPMIFSKPGISAQEKAFLNEHPESAFAPAFKNLSWLYELTLRHYPGLGVRHCLNLHEHFSGLDAQTTHFGDIVHTMPEGDEVIATRYAAWITENLPHLFALP